MVLTSLAPAHLGVGPAEEERWTTIVSGAQMAFRSSAPILDQLYLENFESRLHLDKAQIEVRSASPLGTLQASTFADPSVLVVNYDESFLDAITRDIDLEGWGSRRLFHWYSQYDPKQTATGPDGTRAGADDRHVWIEQKFRSVSFAMAAGFTGAPFLTEMRTRHAASLRTEASKRLKGQLYLSVVTTEENSSPLSAALRNVDRAERRAAVQYLFLCGERARFSQRSDWSGPAWNGAVSSGDQHFPVFGKRPGVEFTTRNFRRAAGLRRRFPPPHE